MALLHDMSDEVAASWRSVVDSVDFLGKIPAALRIRGAMDEDALAKHIMFTANATVSAGARTGARTVIDLLEAAEAISLKDGKFYAQDGSPVVHDNGDSPQSGKTIPALPAPPPALLGNAPTVHVDVQVHIATDASAEQIDAIFASMAKHLYSKAVE